ncbi:MAG: hypothetical protein Q4B48_03835, partial [Syntrophomonadaceae bacterium]|nr:hypothetical protein [Syntrophomonadaceae bacterium]
MMPVPTEEAALAVENIAIPWDRHDAFMSALAADIRDLPGYEPNYGYTNKYYDDFNGELRMHWMNPELPRDNLYFHDSYAMPLNRNYSNILAFLNSEGLIDATFYRDILDYYYAAAAARP